MSQHSAIVGRSWWAISQVIAWIVTLDEEKVRGIPDLPSLDHLPPLAPNQHTTEPPISKVEAPRHLLREWDEGRIEIYGAPNGDGERKPIPKPKYPFKAGFVTHHSRLWLEVKIEAGSGPTEFWTSLWVRSDQCRTCWPAPIQPESQLAEEPMLDAELPDVANFQTATAAQDTPLGFNESAPQDPAALQAKFDAMKRQRIKDRKDHSYDAMTMWARSELGVDSKAAEALWENRSPEFPRKPGRRAKAAGKVW